MAGSPKSETNLFSGSSYPYSVTLEGTNMFRVSCLKCCQIELQQNGYPKKKVNFTFLSATARSIVATTKELQPTKIEKGMVGGAYIPTFGTLPQSAKNKLIQNLLLEHYTDGDLDPNFVNCFLDICTLIPRMIEMSKRKSTPLDGISSFSFPVFPLDYYMDKFPSKTDLSLQSVINYSLQVRNDGTINHIISESEII